MVASVTMYAQDANKSRSLTHSKIYSSGYGAATTQYSRFNGEDAVIGGIYGGWMINHKLMIGFAGYTLLTSHDGYSMDGGVNPDNKLKMGYGGLMLEYTFFEAKRIHVSTNVLLGAGAVVNAYRNDRPDTYGDMWHSEEESGFRVIQPAINIETDVTPWLRVAVGGGYRYITSAEMSGITDKKMSAPTANFSLKFGVF